ncbi:hypothetical protein KPL37_06285 [Clostridium frigoris]|uniref:Uncharacterized protein n=1 Tax=Clostridium frigoris TaxID=205327 RepID=A0ABS6BS95_9CLOT|nr:hypothetical protein [Clostridium frigoris]MBU3159360.1 hypothetical protein [Clostridium frigoris]
MFRIVTYRKDICVESADISFLLFNYFEITIKSSPGSLKINNFGSRFRLPAKQFYWARQLQIIEDGRFEASKMLLKFQVVLLYTVKLKN